MTETCFIHVDLDAFYASVEQLDNPEYQGKPVIVGSLPTDRRGVVSTCSYEARAYGVHSAMPIAMAVKLCPHAVFLRGRMQRYQEKSKEIMSIFADFSPDVHQISVDEAFIDISGTERLFGPPEEVAEKVKSRILEQTGLTVSVGISSTKYIAKIASGMKKPNGLFIVKPGDEEKFILSLRLKDIWGIGGKTIARINKAGFFTPSDIHKASKGMLINLFGNATGSFLYEVVRGQVHETFNETPKSRSLSSERTFSFDLTDRYALETALMELSWDVMYRLFTEQWTSKTAHIKIRYEDFTTVSIQETTQHAISSADDLYLRVKSLFEKKYENGRGIRLIGVSVQNLEDKSLPSQQELFETSDKKKIAVEKTVIEMQKKNPGLNIKKARLLKNSLVFLTTLFFVLTSAQKGFTQDIQSIELAKPFENAFISGEAPIAIFNLTPESSEVEFFAEGSWDATLTGSFSVSGGHTNSNATSFSFAPPIFLQETDLTVWFLLQDTWYFEANVADDYNQNTIAAGYYGDSLLNHVRIGNRFITFDQNYGVADTNNGIGSGSNQSPGIMAEWSGNDWKADAILRYDMIEAMEREWVGEYEATENALDLTDWQTGARFIFPEGTVQNITDVYIQSNDTSSKLYKDSQGISYKKLSPSEYIVIPNKNMLILAKSTNNNVLVRFSSQPDFGSFNTPDSFLGKIQSWFGDIELKNYAIAESNNGFFSTIDGVNVVAAQVQNFFSPFIDASLYSVSSFSLVDNIAILSESSRVIDDSYGAIAIDSSSLETPGFTENDIFNENNSYIQVFNHTASENQAKKAFPFADKHPFVYLNTKANDSIALNQSDTIISIQSLSQSSVLDIGTDAIAGSIIVYRNGIKESFFNYDSNTGLVSLLNPVGTFDTIRITWNQNIENGNNGFLTFAAGYEKYLSEYTKLNASTSILWPIMQSDSFIDSSYDAPGSINFAIHADYKKDNVAIENTLHSSFQLSDVTETYRVDGLGSESLDDQYLQLNANVSIPDSFTPIINARPNQPDLVQLDKNTKGYILSSNTIRDSERGEYTVVSDWEIDQSNGWVAQTIKLGGQATSLASAQTFSIWLKQTALPLNSKVYLQLGVSSDEEELYERTGEIPTWDITSIDVSSDVKPPSFTANGTWQKITVRLHEEDRAKLTINQNARIIIQSDTADTGTLSVGSYEIEGNSFSTTGEVISRESYQGESGKQELDAMKRFNEYNTNFVQYFSWDEALSTEAMSATKYISEIPFSSYKTISFFAYVSNINANASFTLNFERETTEGTEIAFSITLSQEALEQLQNSWNEVSVDLETKKLRISNKDVLENYYSIDTINKTIVPTKVRFEFSGTASMYIDELHLKDALWEFITENDFQFAWENNDILLEKAGIPIFANAKVYSNVHAGIATPLNSDNTRKNLTLVTDSSAKIDILGVSTEAALIYSSSTSDFFHDSQHNVESASHKLITTPIFPVFEVLQLKEDYRYLPLAEGSKKINEIHVDFLPLGLDFQTGFITEADLQNSAYTQDMSLQSSASLGMENFTYNVILQALASQTGTQETKTSYSYTTSWKNTSLLQFSNGFNTADKRNIGFSINQVFDFTDIGLSPALDVSIQNIYTNTTEITNLASDTLRLIFPLTLNGHIVTSSLERKSSIEHNQALGYNYIQDTQYLIQGMQQRPWAYTSIPIFDFFDETLLENIQNSIKKTDSVNIASYNTRASLEWKRSYSNETFDLFIPTSIGTSISRNIRASSADVSDVLQVALNANFLSINNFGKYGLYPIFDWYEQDEIIQSFSLAYELDKLAVENVRLEMTGYNQTSFYRSNAEKISMLTEGFVDTEQDWHIKNTTIWERNGSTSLLVDGLLTLFPSVVESYKGFTRENTIYISLAQIKDDESTISDLQQLYGITHLVDIDVNEFASLGLQLGVELYIENDYFNLKNSISLTGNLQF